MWTCKGTLGKGRREGGRERRRLDWHVLTFRPSLPPSLPPFLPSFLPRDIKSAQWHPHKALIASCSKDSTVKLWDPRAPAGSRCVNTLYGHKSQVFKVRLRPPFLPRSLPPSLPLFPLLVAGVSTRSMATLILSSLLHSLVFFLSRWLSTLTAAGS